MILTSEGRATTAEALHALGYWPFGLVETVKCFLLTAVLFAGPLYEYLVIDEGWRDWLALQPVTTLCSEWMTWRNIVAVSLLFYLALVTFNFLYHFIMMRNLVRVSEQIKTLSDEDTHYSTLCNSDLFP